MQSAELPRAEYPRPDFQREEWMNLNGEWEFEFDDECAGKREKWYMGDRHFSKKIQVPYAFQSKLSGIGETSFHDVVWYQKAFKLPDKFLNKNIIIHFGAADYMAEVWINGSHVKSHEGGFTPFEADITDFIKPCENILVVRVQDFSSDITLPRGKQYFKEKSESIWYTNTTGIWQTVWLEAVEDVYLEKVNFTPYIDTDEIEIEAFVHGVKSHENLYLKVKVTFMGQLLSEDLFRVSSASETRRIKLNEFNEHHFSRLWSPENPQLHDIHMEVLKDDKVMDEVKSYFGMRKISIENGKIFLNNRPYYMKLILDQGYYPQGILTAPSDAAIKEDINLVKAMGFNGVRMHQKVEDPRFLYWCDRMGLLVWGEMANALDFSKEYVRRFISEWQNVIARDYNHPCIVVWVPMNESWGVPKVMNDLEQQHFSMSMYYLTKSLDKTRLVVSNDGWELVNTDLCTIHDYESSKAILKERYSTSNSAVNSLPGRRKIYASGFEYAGEPILITEFGGISYNKSQSDGWGYSSAVDDEDFIKRYGSAVEALLESPAVQGFCYTQFTDIEQEINGLLTCDRKPKIALDIIKSINDSKNNN